MFTKLSNRMCGICGILDFSRRDTVAEDGIRPMAEAMKHRGPDAEGFHSDRAVSLGHRRLSIIDLSDSANQPLVDASGRYTIVFNGELYNFCDVRAELSDYPFRTNGDTEVVLAAFSTWGTSCVERFKGMFAFAIWDSKTQTLSLCRDRLGVKPLYYYHEGGRVVFASEIRSILASGHVKARLDRHALRDYLSFQSFCHPGSPIQGIRQVQAGSWLEFGADGSRSSVYWRAGRVAMDFDYRDRSAVKGRIKELLRNAVGRRMVSDVPLGAFLSGGIDSSVVVGMMAELSSERPMTFNVSFSERGYDESKYAGIIARRFHTRHERIDIHPDHFLGQLEDALDAMDSPSADGANTYVVSRSIRDAGIKVALSGIGGDELFAGYPFFRTWFEMNRYRRLFEGTARMRSLLSSLLSHSSSSRLQRVSAILGMQKLDIKQIYPEFRRVMPDPLIKGLTNLDFGFPLESEARNLSTVDGIEELPILGQVTAAEFDGYTQNTLLKDADQMSMAVSLELREPFFDHDLIDFMMHVPDALRYPTYPKSLLVDSVEPLLPREVVHRRKQGFLFPWRIWMHGPLRDFCETRLKTHACRDFIKGPMLMDRWKRFLSGDASVSWQELWQFVVLEHWMRRNHVE